MWKGTGICCTEANPALEQSTSFRFRLCTFFWYKKKKKKKNQYISPEFRITVTSYIFFIYPAKTNITTQRASVPGMLISTGCCKAPVRQHVVRATCYLMKRVDGLSSSTVFRHCNCSIVDHHHTLVGQSRFADTAGVITRHCLLSITKKKKLYFTALCLHKPSQGLCWYSSR